MPQIVTVVIGVARDSRAGVLLAHATRRKLAYLKLGAGASWHGTKRGDADKECAESATQRPPI